MLLNENQSVAQLLDLIWCAARSVLKLESTCSSTSALCAARLFHVLLNENERVAELLELFWGAGRLLCFVK